jgi:hypothetical protein
MVFYVAAQQPVQKTTSSCFRISNAWPAALPLASEVVSAGRAISWQSSVFLPISRLWRLRYLL